MNKDFEERWGFAPDSDYEIRKTTNPTNPMIEQEYRKELERMGYQFWIGGEE